MTMQNREAGGDGQDTEGSSVTAAHPYPCRTCGKSLWECHRDKMDGRAYCCDDCDHEPKGDERSGGEAGDGRGGKRSIPTGAPMAMGDGRVPTVAERASPPPQSPPAPAPGGPCWLCGGTGYLCNDDTGTRWEGCPCLDDHTHYMPRPCPACRVRVLEAALAEAKRVLVAEAQRGMDNAGMVAVEKVLDTALRGGGQG